LKRAVAAGVAALIAISAVEARESTLTMSCDQARALVAAQGAIVLSTGEFTYERYVADRRFCLIGEDARRSFAPTRDNPKCQIGNVCRPIIRRERSR
jgi:hypothetical protein